MNKPFKLVNKKNEADELQIKAHRSIKSVQSPNHICPTLTTMKGGHREPKILQIAKTECKFDQESRVYGANGISPTLAARDFKSPKKIYINEKYRIRKLTPLECWRLMAFTDEDFYKAKNAGISNSQLYKQAGNSIVVKVLEGIFKNLLIDNEQVKEITTEEEKRKDRNIQLKWCI